MTTRRSPAMALFALLLGTYAYFYQAGGWNQNSRFDLVRALVEQHTFAIDRYEGNTGDDSIRAGHYYCDKAPGASFLCLPTYWLTHQLAGAPEVILPGWLGWAVWLAITIAIGVPSAIAATFLARLALRLGLSPPAAYGVAVLWGLGTMALPYSTLLYGNQLSASLMVIAFALLVEVRHGEPANAGRMFVVGLLLGYAAATEYPAVLIGAPIAAYGLFVAGPRRAGFAVLGGVIPIALLLAYHNALFGSPLAFPYNYSVWENPKTGWFMGIGKPNLQSLKNILFGEYRGLLYTTPWLAAAPLGAVALARRHRVEVAICAWAVIAFLWLNSSMPPWHGGWAAGPRYLVPMLPFLALLAGGVLLYARDVTAGVLGALGLLSVANMFAVTAVKPEIPTDVMRPYAELIWPKFRAGDLAISTQSIDMIHNPPNAPKQAWNLGMQLGLVGQASLVPLYLWLAGSFAWLVWSLRARALNDHVGVGNAQEILADGRARVGKSLADEP